MIAIFDVVFNLVYIILFSGCMPMFQWVMKSETEVPKTEEFILNHKLSDHTVCD